MEIQNLKISFQIHNIIENFGKNHGVNQMAFYVDLLLKFFFCQVSKDNY